MQTQPQIEAALRESTSFVGNEASRLHIVLDDVLCPEPTHVTGCSPKDKPGSVAATEKDRLVIEHLPLVDFVVWRIRERLPSHISVQDLRSAGIMGLVDAASKFDPSKQTRFGTYAKFRIRGAILDSLRDVDWSPRDLRRKGRAVEQAIQVLTSRLERSPDELEIAEQMGLHLKSYQQLLGKLKGLELGTLHVERRQDSEEQELAYIPGKPEDSPLFRCLQSEMRQRVADAITALPERERLVLTLYYYEEVSQKEISKILGVVESRVSQIHASAILHLRAKLAGLSNGA